MFVFYSTYLKKVLECEILQDEVEDLKRALAHQRQEIERIKFDSFAIAKLIGLLNRNYGVPELDPASLGIMSGPEKEAYNARIAESDAIGDRVIRQLKAEMQAIRSEGLET